ncbi:MAG TPA: hypothetical protein VIH31_01155 [Candidatus Paceibacterota bacterium]
MKTKTTALFTFILFFFITASVPATAQTTQTKSDTMGINAINRTSGSNFISIEAHVRPYGNAGITYFELGENQYGLRSFSGQEDETTYALSIPNLNPDTWYAIKMVAANEKGQILNSKIFRFKTSKSNSAVVSGKKKKK